MMNSIVGDSAKAATEKRAEAAVSIIRCRYPVDSILLLRRRENSHDPWSGHFAFPGGRRDNLDKNIYETCLRETFEETGISLDASCLKEKISVTMAGSRVRSPVSVQPFLFELEERPKVVVEMSEIASYLWLDTALFCRIEKHVSAEVVPSYSFPAYPLDDYYLWGFTYGVLCTILGLERR